MKSCSNICDGDLGGRDVGLVFGVSVMLSGFCVGDGVGV